MECMHRALNARVVENSRGHVQAMYWGLPGGAKMLSLIEPDPRTGDVHNLVVSDRQHAGMSEVHPPPFFTQRTSWDLGQMDAREIDTRTSEHLLKRSTLPKLTTFSEMIYFSTSGPKSQQEEC